jgi:predicted DNA-binding transcriptional regulator
LYIPHRGKVERACIRKQWKVFYLSPSEPMVIRILEEIKWENVKNVEQLFHRLGRSGRWLDAHPKLEKELS